MNVPIQNRHFDQFGQLSTLSISNDTSCPKPSRSRRRGRRRRRAQNPVLSGISHVFTKGQWRRSRVSNHPRVNLTVSHEHRPSFSVQMNAVADFGAQIDV